MQENDKLTLDFLDTSLKTLSESLFDIDNESQAVLKIIAENGPSTETRIAKLGRRRTILSREKIRRRMKTTDLSEGFLSVKKGRKIKNLKNKQERIFSLTFKGFLASLAVTPIRDNFWIKNYLCLITNITNDVISQLFLEHIYYFICSFFILNSANEGMLQKYVKPEEEFYDNYFGFGSLTHRFVLSKVKRIPEDYRETFVECLKRFFVSSEVIGSLIIDILPTTCGDDTKGYFATIFFRRWMWTMFFALNKTRDVIMNHYFRNDNYHDMLADDDESKIVNFEAIYGIRLPVDEIHSIAKNKFSLLNPNGRFFHEPLILSI